MIDVIKDFLAIHGLGVLGFLMFSAIIVYVVVDSLKPQKLSPEADSMSERQNSILEVQKLMRARSPWLVFTTLKAVGVSSELEITVSRSFLGVPLPDKQILKDSKLFDAVLQMREHTLVSDSDWFINDEPLLPWFKAVLRHPNLAALTVNFDYDNEPLPFGRKLSEAVLALDLIEYPRGVDDLPQWYRETIGFKEFNDDDSLKKI